MRQRYRPVHRPSHKLAVGVAGKAMVLSWWRGGALESHGARSEEQAGHKGGLNEAAAEAILRDSFLHRWPNKSTS